LGAVPLEGTWRKCRKIEFLGFQIEFLDFWNQFLVFLIKISLFLSSFGRKFRYLRHFYIKIKEFLVENRVFKDFEIEFLPKIEFFDFWPNRVFVKSHKKKPAITFQIIERCTSTFNSTATSLPKTS